MNSVEENIRFNSELAMLDLKTFPFQERLICSFVESSNESMHLCVIISISIVSAIILCQSSLTAKLDGVIFG